tara:strand:+ start:2727 stop:3179 length:453 start_codon:yes stop_codon:yes gene_type:complete
MGEEGRLLEAEKETTKIFGARRISRILSVQGVYHFLHNGATLNTIKNFLSEQEFFNQRDSLFFEDVFANTIDNMDDLREAIAFYLDIPIERLSRVEEAVMLVATYELKSRLDVPLKTIINEAIEIDKCLGSNEGHRVINGVLDKLADKFR